MTWYFDMHEPTEEEKKKLEQKLQEHPENVLVIGLTKDGKFTGKARRK